MTTRTAGDEVESDQAGIIQLGKDNNNKLDIIPSELSEKRTFQQNQQFDILRSIDESLKKILLHNEIITGEKF